jgi:Domain of unknown function (DUF4431)
MLGRGICICVALLYSPISATADCLKANVEGQMAQGQLTIGRAHDAAGRIERPYILHLTTDACLDSDDPDEAVKSTRTIHVFFDNDTLAPAFRRLVGKSVIVHGSPFAAMTAHHHAPIVMGITEISAR